MLAYYLELAARSLKRNAVLSALMVLAIGLGIGTSITTLTILHLLSGDPLPQKSGKLFYPQLDPRENDDPEDHAPLTQLTYIDAMALMGAKRADRQAIMVHGSIALHPEGMSGFFADSRYTGADFFEMFATPFAAGGPWSAADDDAAAHDVVISKKLNQKLFGSKASIGKTLRIKESDFRIVGVLDDWRPTTRFYDLSSGRNFGSSEDVFLPFSTAEAMKLNHTGSINCYGKEFDASHLETAPCVWLQYWVELDSAQKVAAYRDYLIHYSLEQKSLGRFQLAPNVRLDDLMGWLDDQHAVPSDVRLQTWLAFGFLLVCLVNTVGLMLAKFLRRTSEICVRRALGATRAQVFRQFLTEAGVIGFAGGMLGLLLALLGLWAVRQQPAAYSSLVHLDLTMFATTFALAVLASLAAGLLPAFRACSVPPALQLKSN